MSNFMGPMAPPPAAQPQPQALDFKTDPNQRQRFRQFMRERVSPNVGQAPAMMPNGIGTTMPTPQMAMPQMPMTPQPPMMPSMAPGAGIDVFSPQYMNQPAAPMGFADGGSVSDALADALSNDIGDYSADDTMTDLSQTSYNDFDPGGNESFDAAAMDQFRNQQVSDLSNTIGQQIQSSIKSNQQMGTPAPVPQSVIEQMQFENLQNVPSTEPVFSMPNLNLGGMSTSFDLLGNPLTLGFKDGGSVPPRETDIRGMHHELAYITPDEADILEALGGTGEAGPMGIPTYIPDDGNRGTDTDTSDAPSGPSGGESSSSGNDSPGNDGNDGYDPGDYVGYTEEDEQQQTKDMQDYEENVFGGDSPDGYSVQDILNDNAGISGTLGGSYNMDAINRGRQQRQALAETLANTLENEVETGKVSGPVVSDGDIESLDALTNAVESSSRFGGTGTGSNLLGSDNLLGLPDELTGTLMGGPAQSPTVTGMTDQDTEEDADYVGGAKVGPRFGTATGPGRLSSVTAEEMEALRTGNLVQRQMYRQLAGVDGKPKVGGAFPTLSSFDPNNVEGNFFDTIANTLSKPSSAIEVFRAPITEQKGFKSVNTGNFKDGIAGVTGMGNTPGVIGGIMQMFGIDPIVYTGDNRFDPNRPPEDFGGGGDDNVLLPLPPEEEVPASTTPNQMPGMVAPSAPTAPGSVLVPSTRTSAPFSGQMPVGYGTPQTGQINPYSLADMQLYQQILARLGQSKSPIGLANGGSVLDAAAGKFLESLTAA